MLFHGLIVHSSMLLSSIQVQMNHNLIIQLSVGGPLLISTSWNLCTNPCVNMFSVVTGMYLWVELLYHMFMFNFLRNSNKSFLTAAALFYIPTSSVQGSSLSTFLPHVFSFLFFKLIFIRDSCFTVLAWISHMYISISFFGFPSCLGHRHPCAGLHVLISYLFYT